MSVRYLSITLEVEVECAPDTTDEQAGRIVDKIRQEANHAHRNVLDATVEDWDLSPVYEQQATFSSYDVPT
jgi:hypothetical protein